MVRFRLTPPPRRPPETRLALRRLTLVDGDVIEHRSFVFCPFRAVATDTVECMTCADLARVETVEAIVCAREAPLTDGEALELISRRQIYSGTESLAARTPVGAVAGTVVVCATPTTRIAVVESVASELAAPGVVVIDEARRPTAFVSRASLVATPAALALTLADCQDEAFTIFDERDSLAHALGRLVHDRQRAAVTIDAVGRVTGLVSDLEVLRWLARASRGHMSGG